MTTKSNRRRGSSKLAGGLVDRSHKPLPPLKNTNQQLGSNPLLPYPHILSPDSDPTKIFQRRPRPTRLGKPLDVQPIAISSISFDRFLEQNCPPIYQEDLLESYHSVTKKSLSLLNLRVWDNVMGEDSASISKSSLLSRKRWSGMVTRITRRADYSRYRHSFDFAAKKHSANEWKRLDARVVERRTKLWMIVLASYYDSSFTSAAKTAKLSENSVALLPQFGINPPLILSSAIERFFTVPPSRTSRTTGYTLLPTRSSTWPLPLQQLHVSPYTIPTELADISCTTLGVTTLFHLLNDIFGSRVSLDPSLKRILERCIRGEYWLVDEEDEDDDFDEEDRPLEYYWDVGRVYGFLRPWWTSGYTFSDIVKRMKCRKREDARMRRNTTLNPHLPGMMDSGAMMNREIPPRRVWDLYSNRVMPFFALRTEDPYEIPDNVWAVSHSWVADYSRRNHWTGVNGREWPVSIPNDTSLDHVRIELLNMGAEYVFLDVLCLRQQGPTFQEDGEEFRRGFGLRFPLSRTQQEATYREALRSREWKVDVTTLGHAYRHKRYQTTVVYFNGLGLPFDIRRHILESPYHWFNRAWTLQETMINWLPGGLTPLALRHEDSDGPYFLDCMRRSLDSLGTTTGARPGYIDILNAMQGRPGFADKKPFDRVAALAYLLPTPTCPAYNEALWESVGDAWSDVIVNMTDSDRLDLLVRYPSAGNQMRFGVQIHWRPSWEQTMTSRLQDVPGLTV